jgi:hypothetical protein
VSALSLGRVSSKEHHSRSQAPGSAAIAAGYCAARGTLVVGIRKLIERFSEHADPAARKASAYESTDGSMR